MRREPIWLVVTSMLLCVACNEQTKSPEDTPRRDTSASSQQPAQALTRGVLPPSASEGERRAAIYDLFAGGKRWNALPERATDGLSAFDPELPTRLAPTRHRAPHVSLPKGLKVAGALSSDVVERVVSTKRGRARLCYEKALKHDPELKGRVAVTLLIGRNGQLTTNSASGDSGLEKVAACIKRSFFGAQFPAPKTGTVSVFFTIEFVPHG